MPNLIRQIGRNIKSLRKNRHLTQEGIANRAGINYRHYQNIEAGTVDIKITTLQSIARQLHVEPASLLVKSSDLSGGRALGKNFREILELAPCGIQMNDLKGIITFSNAAHRALHGYSESELVGKMHIWDLLASRREREELRAYFGRLLTGKLKQIPYYGINRIKNGGTVPVRVSWRYVFDPKGKLRGFISSIEPSSETRPSKGV